MREVPEERVVLEQLDNGCCIALCFEIPQQHVVCRRIRNPREVALQVIEGLQQQRRLVRRVGEPDHTIQVGDIKPGHTVLWLAAGCPQQLPIVEVERDVLGLLFYRGFASGFSGRQPEARLVRTHCESP